MPGSHGAHHREIRAALEDGQLTEEEINTSVQRVLHLMEHVRPRSQHYHDSEYHDEEQGQRNQPTFSWTQQHALAKSAAMECAVLLQNKDEFLPLTAAEISSIGVIGGFGKSFPRYQGMGSSRVNAQQVCSAYDELFRYFDHVSFAQGYENDNEDFTSVRQDLIDEAVQVAKGVEVVILCVGLEEISESEGFDRPHLQLTAQHNTLVTEVCKVNPNVVVVLSNGGAIEMPWIDVPKAVFESYLLGEAGAAAIVDLIFGVASPSGKLAETFPQHLTDVLSDKYFPGDRNVVEHREGLDVGYRYFDTVQKDVLFPFGHGLSYTTFHYSALQLQVLDDSPDSKLVKVTFQLSNTGKYAAKETVQCYVHDSESSVYRPYQELKGFDKVALNPGEVKEVSLILNSDSFSFYDVGAKNWVVESGSFDIRIGSSSRDIRSQETIVFQTGSKVSNAAKASYPRRPYGQALDSVDDETFHRRLETYSEPDQTMVVPVPGGFTRNALLKEVSAYSILGSILKWAVFKGACADIKQGPAFNRDVKLMRAATDNLPLRTMVLFSKGGLSFELMDAMIALMNGHYRKALWLFRIAFTPFRRRANYRDDSQSNGSSATHRITSAESV